MSKKLTDTNPYIRSSPERHSRLEVTVATSSAVEGVRVKSFGAARTAKSTSRTAIKSTAAVSSKSRR